MLPRGVIVGVICSRALAALDREGPNSRIEIIGHRRGFNATAALDCATIVRAKVTDRDEEGVEMIWKAIPLTLLLLAPVMTNAEPDIDCRIRLQFSSDDSGAVANYVLTLQIKNTLGRAVHGVSVNYFDNALNQLGNTALACSGALGDGIPPSSHGECLAQLQKVDGNLLDRFGTKMWTEIVNTQLSQLESIRKCEVIGFSY